MKELIDNSIEIYGIGHPDVKTIFNIGDQDKESVRFSSLEKLQNRKLTIRFKYSENDEIFEDKVVVTIPNENEEFIKEFIIDSIVFKLDPTPRKRKRKNS